MDILNFHKASASLALYTHVHIKVAYVSVLIGLEHVGRSGFFLIGSSVEGIYQGCTSNQEYIVRRHISTITCVSPIGVSILSAVT